MQVARVFYTSYCGYFLAASFAHRLLLLSSIDPITFFLNTQIFGRAVKPIQRAASSTAVLLCLSRNRQVLLSSHQTYFVKMFPPKPVALSTHLV